MTFLKKGCLYVFGALFGMFAFVVVLGLIIDLSDPEGAKQRKKEREIAEAAEAAKAAKEPKPVKLIDATAFDAKRGEECGEGGKVTQMAYAVSEEGILRKLPQAGPPSVPFMSMGKAVPAPLEKSMTVRELCRKGNWSEVRIVTLPGHELQGWVPSGKLRAVPSDPSGRRAYRPEDFEWTKETGKQKAAVVKLANRIMQQRTECLAMDTNNLVLTGPAERGTFSIPCFAGKDMLSFSFRAGDAESGRSFEKVEPMEETDAVTACRAAAQRSAMHPSTVDFEMRYEFEEASEGRTQVRQPFTAKNSFGLELRHQALCDFSGRTLENISFKEIP